MPGRRRRTTVPPATTDATASMPSHGKHPFDAMLLAPTEEIDSDTEIEIPPKRERATGPGKRLDYKIPRRPAAEEEEVPDGYVRTRGGNLAETVSGRGPTQAQFNWIVDLLEEKDLTSVGLFARNPDLSYEEGKLELRRQAFMGDRRIASQAIEMLKILPRKQGDDDIGSSDDDRNQKGRLRVKYTEVRIDGGRTRRIGYLTDQPKNDVDSEGYLRIPECKFALDTSADGRFANDVTFFHLWVGDRHGWKLYMYKSDDEIEMPVGKAVPLIRRFAANMGEALKRWGDEYSRCGICSRKLTNDVSRQYGIGPVCRAQWGL